MVDNLKQVVEDCLSRIDQGVSMEDCLASYPQFADELEPLLAKREYLRKKDVALSEACLTQ